MLHYQGENYIVADQVGHSNKFPYLKLDVLGDLCVPTRKVFMKLHKHEEIEFILVSKGYLSVETSTENIIVRAGEALFIPKNKLHVLKPNSSTYCTIFLFLDIILLPFSNWNLYGEVKRYTENFRSDFALITGEHQNVVNKLISLSEMTNVVLDKDLSKFKLLSHIYDLWYEFSMYMQENEINRFQEGCRKNERLKRYLEFIRLNYSDEISIHDIARSSYTSVSECNRVFRELMRTTPYNYLIRYRINRSCELIKTKEYTVLEVSEYVGYKSSSHFIKQFKKHMKMTPYDYMKLW